MNNNTIKILKSFQKSEITEYHTYRMLSTIPQNINNKDLLLKLANQEHSHYLIFKKYTDCEVAPSLFKAKKNYLISKYLGVTFGLKVMELREQSTQEKYSDLIELIPEIKNIIEDEERHETEIIALLKEEKLLYISSIVLGLNDALIELTGALAGYTFALQNAKLIAVVGLITGIAASMSMAASEYLSSKADDFTQKNNLKSALYTGIAYIFTVILLILPFILGSNSNISLIFSLLTAIAIICIFNYYVAVVANESFKKRFLEMATLSLGIAGISFFIGIIIKKIFGINL